MIAALFFMLFLVGAVVLLPLVLLLVLPLVLIGAVLRVLLCVILLPFKIAAAAIGLAFGLVGLVVGLVAAVVGIVIAAVVILGVFLFPPFLLLLLFGAGLWLLLRIVSPRPA